MFGKRTLSLSLHEPVAAAGLKNIYWGEEAADQARESLSEARSLDDDPTFKGN